MASGDFAKVRQLFSKGTVMQVNSDTPVAIRMRYVGTGTVTSVAVVTATAVTTITSDGGTDVFDFATYSTLGALVDAINDFGIFEAKLLDGLRSYLSDDQLFQETVSATTFGGQTIWDVKVKTAAVKFYLGIRLTYDRGFQKRNSAQHRVHLQEITYALNGTTGAGADNVQVWECTPGGMETKVLSDVSVDTTETAAVWAGGRGKLTAAEGNDLFVVVKDASGLTNDALNFLRIVGILE